MVALGKSRTDYFYAIQYDSEVENPGSLVALLCNLIAGGKEN